MLILTLFVGFMVYYKTCSAPINSDYRAAKYLKQYGYLDRSTKSDYSITERAFKDAVLEFQRFVGLEQTGIIDEDTLDMMNAPRCGVPDYRGSSREKRYVLSDSKYRIKVLSYSISKYTKQMRRATIDREIEKAFKVWSDVSELEFYVKPTATEATFEIRFEKGYHYDDIDFDGPGGILAHANFPEFGGDIHFDDDEYWTLNKDDGTNLLQVAAHEIGHSLGLAHSDVRNALMAPIYSGYDPDFKLHKDDIKAIRVLYGQRKEEGPNPGPKPSPKPAPSEINICKDPSFDTIFLSANKEIIVFKGKHYWELTEDGVKDGYPRLISTRWYGLPSDIDAAFSHANGKTYFFKDDSYWRFKGRYMDVNYPKKIAFGFQGIPNKVDAAFVWSGNDKIYFFKGRLYWKYDPERNPPVDSFKYPRTVSNWEGIPDNISAAFQWTNHYTYFFKNASYWRFNDSRFKVDSAQPSFPRPVAQWWFGCSLEENFKSSNEENGNVSTEDDSGDTDNFWDASDSASSFVIGFFDLFL